MKNLCLFLFLFSFFTVFSQIVLKGKIFDKDNIPLDGVNIYIDGTTFSTISDTNGNFTIKYEPNANTILVISSMGYQTEYLKGLDAAKPLNVRMLVSKTNLKKLWLRQMNYLPESRN